LDVLEAILGSSLQSIEIRDRDGMLDEFRTEMIGSSDRRLHVLILDCIESYLISPVVLTRVVNELLEERSKDRSATVERLVGILDEVAGAMRQEAEDRLAERYSSDAWRFRKERPGVPELLKVARPFLAQHWGDPSSRLVVLPGKRYLGVVRQALQSEFGVTFGNERLAEAFEPDEVPAELTDLLVEIQSLKESAPRAPGPAQSAARLA
jgi:hypothetical protein